MEERARQSGMDEGDRAKKGNDGGQRLLWRPGCDILAQGLIGFDRILIPPQYILFSRSPTKKISGVKHA
jgi:hypothetical protein